MLCKRGSTSETSAYLLVGAAYSLQPAATVQYAVLVAPAEQAPAYRSCCKNVRADVTLRGGKRKTEA